MYSMTHAHTELNMISQEGLQLSIVYVYSAKCYQNKTKNVMRCTRRDSRSANKKQTNKQQQQQQQKTGKHGRDISIKQFSIYNSTLRYL